jgi:hypothetical protein
MAMNWMNIFPMAVDVRVAQDQSHVVFLENFKEPADTPAFAMQAGKIVGNQGDDITASKALLECLPSGAVLHEPS